MANRRATRRERPASVLAAGRFRTGRLYTIGYQRLMPQDLLAIASRLDALVVDCRVMPWSRKPGFSRAQLQRDLGRRYVWRGDHLGGRGFTDAAGLDSVRTDLQRGRTLLLLCMEAAPQDCHRHFTICGPHFPHALHILDKHGAMLSAQEVSLQCHAL